MVFKDTFDIVAVAGHLLLGFFSVLQILKTFVKIFNLTKIAAIVLLAVLLFPYFPPLSIALNLTSEGLAYPFYLLTIAFSLKLIFQDSIKSLFWLCLAYLLLSLTRGQFIIIAPVIISIYFLKKRKAIRAKKHLLSLAILFVLPFFNILIEKTYRKIFYGFFNSPPYTFINAVTLPLYISNTSDTVYFKKKDEKDIFIMSYRHMDSLGLVSTKVRGTNSQKYLAFHKNFPKICNQNIYEKGITYYQGNGEKSSINVFKTEATCKKLFGVLIMHNFKDWVSLYLAGIIYGFKGIIPLILTILLFIISFGKCYKGFSSLWGIILLSTLLILSNAFIVAIVSHSIMRYLFYNYFLGVLILILFLKKIKPLAKP